MAIYHLSVKPVSRSTGRSATAAAAYRAGELGEPIADKRTGEVHDYTRKRGVLCAEIVLPQSAYSLPGANDQAIGETGGGNGQAQSWAQDRASLWNAAELAEKRKDACVAREYEVALPTELSPTERRRLALDFARDMANREGCAVDVCIHEPGRGGDDRNNHAHLLRTTRRVEAQGLGAKLDTEKAGRNRVADLEFVRQRWAQLTNERLREAGIDSRVDHRSLEDQGIEREPTKHLGPAATGYERRTGRASDNRMRQEEVAERLTLARQAGELERERRQLDSAIIDLSGDLEAALRERERGQEREREIERQRERRQEGKRQIDALTAAQVRRVIEQIRPAPTSELVASNPAVIQALQRKQDLSEQIREAQVRQANAEYAASDWRRQHPLRAKMHDSGVLSSPSLAECDQAASGAANTAVRLERELAAAEAKLLQVRQETQLRTELATAERWQEVKAWERILRTKEAQEARAAQERRQEQERAEVPGKFTELAALRAARALGYDDNGKQWLATPAPIRLLVDTYNVHTPKVREAMLQKMAKDPELTKHVGVLLEQRRQNVLQLERNRDYGLEL